MKKTKILNALTEVEDNLSRIASETHIVELKIEKTNVSIKKELIAQNTYIRSKVESIRDVLEPLRDYFQAEKNEETLIKIEKEIEQFHFV